MIADCWTSDTSIQYHRIFDECHISSLLVRPLFKEPKLAKNHLVGSERERERAKHNTEFSDEEEWMPI